MKNLIFILCTTLILSASVFAQNNIRKINFQNFTYDADYCGGEGERKITVKDGEFFEEKKVDDFTERMFFSVFGVTYGDLDGDSKDEAVVLSICNMGGTGNFSEAYIYKLVNGKPVRKMTLVGGDRAFGGLRETRVENGLLVVESNDAGKLGGACCAEFAVTNTYRFDGKTLKEIGKSTSRELYPSTRISFEKGAFGKKLRIKMSAIEQLKRFKIGGASGQTLMVTAGPDAKLRLRTGDARVLEEDTSLVAKLNKTGDYVFQLSNYTDRDIEFTMSVTIKNSGYTYTKPAASTSTLQKIESVYTDLAVEKCKSLDSDLDGGEGYRGECPGVGDYKLEVLEGDLRQTINVVQKNSGDKWELDLWSVVSPQFSALGEKVEWRVRKQNGVLRPLALIVRYNASEDPEDSSKLTSYLVVSKIKGEFVCVTDIIKPMKGQNLAARKAADASGSKPCLKRR